jgi:hypothetical protein
MGAIAGCADLGQENESFQKDEEHLFEENHHAYPIFLLYLLCLSKVKKAKIQLYDRLFIISMKGVAITRKQS